MDAIYSRPENLLLWTIPVPPVPIRPSVVVDTGGGGSNEDDITMKLQEIIDWNNALKIALDKGGTIKMAMEVLYISYLFYYYFLIFYMV